MLCVTVFLSYLPEAGQYSCFFVYLRLVMDFSKVFVFSIHYDNMFEEHLFGPSFTTNEVDINHGDK